MENNIDNYNHAITLVERKNMLITGVKKIDNFDVTLNYVDIEGNMQQYVIEPYECFVTDLNRSNRHFKGKTVWNGTF